jgi:hypothetical protein
MWSSKSACSRRAIVCFNEERDRHVLVMTKVDDFVCTLEENAIPLAPDLPDKQLGEN